ncbi:unnamed protein product [Cylindrotheca closterium]|uniref:Uncharacterized protein n=1 Tax=Cylindrotheca closterium TaxID=2856 RepID=A0AAD2GD96_9STRA|nr:unnamed protein product [Cylindrotheca closterium]
MPSPLNLYFENLKQKHQLDDIVVIDDRSPSSPPASRARKGLKATKSDGSCRTAQPIDTDDTQSSTVKEQPHVDSAKPTISRSVHQIKKFVATTA